MKLARPYYDFYFYGGFYHGVKLVEKAPKVFVRTRDYATGTVEVQVEGPVPAGAKLAIDGRPVAAQFVRECRPRVDQRLSGHDPDDAGPARGAEEVGREAL